LLYCTFATFGLRTSWAKTKLQNLGSGPSPTSLQIDDNSVESVDSLPLIVWVNLHSNFLVGLRAS